MVSLESNCRIAAYDVRNAEFMGYQSDVLWSLSPVDFMRHPEKDTGLAGILMRNLLYCLGEVADAPHNILLAVERITEGIGVTGLAAKYLVGRVDDGQYAIRYVARELLD